MIIIYDNLDKSYMRENRVDLKIKIERSVEHVIDIE